jgi:hypothetical protein
MTITVAELYEALRAANVDEAKARAAAAQVLGREETGTFATKTDIAEIKTMIAEAKGETIRWFIGTALTLAALWVGVAALLLRLFTK